MFQRDNSGPRDAYFLKLQKALHEAGVFQPVLVLDLERLKANIYQLKSDLPQTLNLRIVAKSLPVPNLLELVASELGSNRYMTFNLPMLHEIADLDPNADQLLGKPLPVAAAASYYSNQKGDRSAGKIYWLIDSPERLQQYQELAEAHRQPLNLVFELDVGLHRGGFEVDNWLEQALERVHRSELLSFSGFMGYEAHVSKVPELFGLRKNALAKAWKTYEQALLLVKRVTGQAADQVDIRNAAGSPTFRHYRKPDLANEVSVGSALVKPRDFETDLLADYVPAIFIATPALKVQPVMKTPFLEFLDPLKRRLNPNLDKAIFVHGGYWKANPIDPPGLSHNSVFGRSSNQDLLNGGPATNLEADDFVFLQPTQSEAVMMQFGEIIIYENGAIIDSWSPFEPSV